MSVRIGLVGASLIAMLTAFEPAVAANECTAKQRTCKLDCENRSSNMRMSFGDAVCIRQCVSKIAACKGADADSSSGSGTPKGSGSPPS